MFDHRWGIGPEKEGQGTEAGEKHPPLGGKCEAGASQGELEREPKGQEETQKINVLKTKGKAS